MFVSIVFSASLEILKVGMTTALLVITSIKVLYFYVVGDSVVEKIAPESAQKDANVPVITEVVSEKPEISVEVSQV